MIMKHIYSKMMKYLFQCVFGKCKEMDPKINDYQKILIGCEKRSSDNSCKTTGMVKVLDLKRFEVIVKTILIILIILMTIFLGF